MQISIEETLEVKEWHRGAKGEPRRITTCVVYIGKEEFWI